MKVVNNKQTSKRQCAKHIKKKKKNNWKKKRRMGKKNIYGKEMKRKKYIKKSIYIHINFFFCSLYSARFVRSMCCCAEISCFHLSACKFCLICLWKHQQRNCSWHMIYWNVFWCTRYFEASYSTRSVAVAIAVAVSRTRWMRPYCLRLKETWLKYLQWMEIKYRCECKNWHNIDKNMNEIETHDQTRTRNRCEEPNKAKKKKYTASEQSFFFSFFSVLVVTSVTAATAASFVLLFFHMPSCSLYYRVYIKIVYELHVWKLFMTDSDGRKGTSKRVRTIRDWMYKKILCVRQETVHEISKQASSADHNFFSLYSFALVVILYF